MLSTHRHVCCGGLHTAVGTPAAILYFESPIRRLRQMIASRKTPATWDESEAMELTTALSVIDTWGGDLDMLFDLDSDSSSSDVSHQPKKLKSKGCKAPYKRRDDTRRHEIAGLRTQVQELQDVVMLAKAVVVSATDAVTFQCRWKQIAETQQQRRLTAELTNAKLRKVLQAQGNYSRRITKLTKQTSPIEQALSVPALPSFVDYLGPSIDPETQLRSMDTLISQATRVFSYKAFAATGIKSFQQTQFLTSTPPENGADLECQAVWMLPFDVQQVADALWVQTMRPTNNYKTSMDIYEDTNALVSRFMATSDLSDEWGAAQGQVAARILPRDLGDGSVLIVMKMEAKSYVGTEARGCASFNGWIRVESVPSQDAARTGPLSRIKWYRRTLMQPPIAATLSKSERCKWTQAVLASSIRAHFEKELVLGMLAIENKLLARLKEVS